MHLNLKNCQISPLNWLVITNSRAYVKNGAKINLCWSSSGSCARNLWNGKIYVAHWRWRWRKVRIIDLLITSFWPDWITGSLGNRGTLSFMWHFLLVIWKNFKWQFLLSNVFLQLTQTTWGTQFLVANFQVKISFA